MIELRLVVVEDVPEDAELAIAELRRAGMRVEWRRVDSEDALAEALAAELPDAILSDYSLPGFSGLDALRLARQQAPHVPFVIYTGTINEETAVACMKAGAWDYVLKEKLARLPSALTGAVELARTRAERQLALAELRASEERYRGLVHTSFDCIWEVDADRRYTYVSPRVADVLGFAPEELIGRTPFDFMPAGEAERVGAAFAAVAERREPFACLENVNRHRNGRLVVLETSGVPVFAPDGSFRGYRGIDRDITERRRAEEQRRALEAQLMQAQKLEGIGRLAGGVAHDFNNILQALMGQAAVLRAQAPAASPLAGAVDEVDQLVRRGAALTRQLLLFSRKEKVQQAQVDLNEVVREATTLLRRVVRANVAIESALADCELPVLADAGQIEQVLMNLVVNASDAMPEGGAIVMTTGGTAQCVWVRVADTGYGVSAEVKAKIFDPFFTTKAAGKGTGLGLSVVHGIAAGHGGSVAVESEEGRGAAFTVSLPRSTGVACDPVATAGSPQRGGAAPRGAGERVLVVEDEEGTRAALVALLDAQGYEVTAFGSGEDAMRLPETLPFRVLLTDLMLPGVGGNALAAALRRRWPDLRVIVMSGYGEEETQAAAHGPTGRFLQKPFDADTLARAVAAALG